MKKLFSGLVLGGIISAAANAALPVWVQGQVTRVYADPSDAVYVVDSGGSSPCGAIFYHVRRTNENFKEFYSLLLTAFTAGKNVSVRVVECDGDRNITSQGYIW